jgi:hypothetical protein
LDDGLSFGAHRAGTMTSRRFPAPWGADKIPGGYVVRDANGQALVYVTPATMTLKPCKPGF